jgi:cyclopropane fatty-acyl-phospholipid synthase-like methyltransferase
MVRESDELIAAGYDSVADAYAALEREGEWPRQRWLADLLSRLRAGARVLDFGCGSGIPATRSIVDAGHSVVAADISPEQVRRARQNVPEAEVILAGALDLQLEPESLDAVVAFYVVDHIPREQHGQLLASVHRWLCPGGWLLLTFEIDDQPGIVGDWLGVPMFFSHYDAATSQQLVRQAGFEIVRAAEETQQEGNRPVPYLWLLARKSR